MKVNIKGRDVWSTRFETGGGIQGAAMWVNGSAVLLDRIALVNILYFRKEMPYPVFELLANF